MQSKLPLPYFFHLYDVASTPVVCKMKGLAHFASWGIFGI